MKLLQSPQASLAISVLGSLDHPEFRAAGDWMAAHADCVDATQVQDFGSELQPSPDLVVLACARRGQFHSAHVAQLKCNSPLAPVVALVGSWCAGPWRRPCDLLTGAWLVPWHQWNAWADYNLQMHEQSGCSTWSLPVTSTADELADFWSQESAPRAGGLVAIDARDRETAEAIADPLALAGFATAWWPRERGRESFSLSQDSESPSTSVRKRLPAPSPNASERLLRGAAAYICDGGGMNESLAGRVRAYRVAEPEARIVVLLNFPQWDEIAAARRAGADLVVAKPFTVGELLGQLTQLLAPAARPAASA